MRDMAELNVYLRECCVRDHDRNSSGKTETIGVRFEQDRTASASLPKYRFDTSFRRDAKVDKYQPSRTVYLVEALFWIGTLVINDAPLLRIRPWRLSLTT
jgi:hypothetical protein